MGLNPVAALDAFEGRARDGDQPQRAIALQRTPDVLDVIRVVAVLECLGLSVFQSFVFHEFIIGGMADANEPIPRWPALFTKIPLRTAPAADPDAHCGPMNGLGRG